MEWLIDALWSYINGWTGALASIFLGCTIIYLKLCSVSETQKTVEKRLDRFEGIAVHEQEKKTNAGS